MKAPAGWTPARFGDFVHVEHGWPFRSQNYTAPIDGQPIIVSIGNFEYTGGFRFDRSNVKGYDGEYPSEFELEAGDLLLVMTCQTEGGEILGLPARVPSDGRVYLHNQRIGRVVFDLPAGLDPNFAYHLARTPEFNRQLCVTASGSKILHTAPKRIEAVTFSRPPLAEQREIAEVLGALDDKIAANAKLVTTADELARLRFESLLDEAEMRPLSSLARFVNGKAFTKGASGTGRVVIRIAELNSGIGGSTVYNDIDVADDHLARPGDLLFAWSGSLTVHRWFRPEGIINQHIFKVIPDGYPMWVIKGSLDRKLLEFKAIAADKATTMGHIQRRHLDEEVAVPTHDDVAAWDAGMSALWDRALSAEQEALRLEALREVLLPQLMSGKIRVRDAERVVEGVV